MVAVRQQLEIPQPRRGAPVVIDLFAGGGGASEGIREALGVSPWLAVNHDDHAISMHTTNHPESFHLREDLLRLSPVKPRRGSVDLLWASPDCCEFSRAKGAKPKQKHIRLLPWTVVEWAREVMPRVIILENVAEFQDWGPLDENDRPIKARKGETFREWLAALQLAGYRLEYRVLNAADYGTPTSRKRLFLIARCDGQPIVWPEPTHGPGRALPYRSASECIDYAIPVRSIFGRKHELAEATQRRIAAGVKRFVLESANPFLIRYQGERRPGENGRVAGLSEPLPTLTTEPRFALVAPCLVTTSNGEREGQAPRARDITRPLGTVCATGSQGALVAAWLAKHNGSGPTWNAAIGQSLGAPVHTVTATDTKALMGATLSRDEEGNARKVFAFLTKYYGTGTSFGQTLGEPLHTIRTGDCFGLVTVEVAGERYVVSDIGMRMLRPHELARAQGFGSDYKLTGTLRDQTARIGNSVCPPVAAAVVRANFADAVRAAA